MTRGLIAVSGTLAVFGIGLVVGRAVVRAPGSEPAAARAANNKSVKPATAQSTRAGAVASASAILYAFDLPTVLSQSRFEAAVERVAAPGSEARVRRLFGR